MKYETRFNKIFNMPDSDLKLSKFSSLGLSIPTPSDKLLDKIHSEEKRLHSLGYKDLALRYLERIEKERLDKTTSK